MYRRSALEQTKYQRPDGGFEYFDEDFHSYWEDVDLSLRLVNAGYICKYVSQAISYHGRGVGSSEQGYKNVKNFIKHHQQFPARILRLNAKNHIFLYLKNLPRLYPQFFLREFFYWGYVTVLETKTLGVIPELFRQLPLMWKKRKFIRQNRHISAAEFERMLV